MFLALIKNILHAIEQNVLAKYKIFEKFDCSKTSKQGCIVKTIPCWANNTGHYCLTKLSTLFAVDFHVYLIRSLMSTLFLVFARTRSFRSRTVITDRKSFSKSGP